MNHEEFHNLFYWKITDLWKRLCQEHTNLLDKTFEEYHLLLSSDVDNLEKTIEDKNNILQTIAQLESLRQELIGELNHNISSEAQIKGVFELISYMQAYEEERKEKHLFRFNALLIDIIEKIQEQNKKNQLFINKAIHSLQGIKDGALGNKKYATYNAKGNSQKSSNIIK